ncbi:2OG-Fe(II) oxygenase [Neobacillus dielmonensis]|uniref:2OG-Fe(II) oxygenase n=1 Tax=Neobacillus dielmonensis TaxID=1347369 RepID=UPI0005AAF086|nr:2OG-Fe(II) oxygenase [Neobacillus dielmonensis]
MEKIKHISAEFKDWILNTLKSGASPEAIAAAMIKKGFDETFAYQTLLRIVGNQSVKTAERSQAPFVYEVPEIGQKGNIIATSDRDIKVLSRVDHPFILHLDNLLSYEECDELINLSKDRLQPSEIIDSETGEKKAASGRTSKGMYFTLGENWLVTAIEKRIAELTNYPVENGEGLQVLNYKIGEEYKPHFDYFPSTRVNPEQGGQRIGTLLIYLNDVPAGGETVFPKAGVTIVPKKGTAVYFHYGNSKNQVDRMSLHTSIPVAQGEKWVATKWIRQAKIY